MFATFNGNWATAEQAPVSSDADVFFALEHKLAVARQKDTSALMLQLGLKSSWSAPGNEIGGAGIFVRRHLDAWSNPA
eukprot:8380071-Pyramimonas_sp.AAC.1